MRKVANAGFFLALAGSVASADFCGKLDQNWRASPRPFPASTTSCVCPGRNASGVTEEMVCAHAVAPVPIAPAGNPKMTTAKMTTQARRVGCMRRVPTKAGNRAEELSRRAKSGSESIGEQNLKSESVGEQDQRAKSGRETVSLDRGGPIEAVNRGRRFRWALGKRACTR